MSDVCMDHIVLDGWAKVYCARTDRHTLHQSERMEWRRASGDDSGFIRQRRQEPPVHWRGTNPTSLHGNGAASFEHTTRDRGKVTCRLCFSILERDDIEASLNGDTPWDRERS